MANVVVLGGAGLIGSAISSAAAEQGYKVCVADYNYNAAQKVADNIVKVGGMAVPAFCDVSDGLSIRELISSLEGSFGQINSVVNSTYLKGKGYGKKLVDVTVNDFCETVSLQLGSVFSVFQEFSRYFSLHSSGSFVTIGSIYGSIAPRFSIYEGTQMTTPVEYAVTKSALSHLNRYYAQAYKKNGIRFNIVSPGGILDSQPKSFVDAYGHFAGLKGMLDPEDIVEAVLFLLSPNAKYVTAQEILVDDGFSL